MKIFFFGGTFDPPHKGHECIVNHLLPLCDKFIVFPAGLSPSKSDLPLADINHRINMLKILFNNKKITIDDFDLNKNQINYTYLTISYLKKKYKNSSLSMIIGKDQLINFHHWKNYKLINKNVDIICFNREIEELSKEQNLLNYDINFIKEFNINVSSSEIRSNFYNSKHDSMLHAINPKIMKYIKDNNLYV